ncbi:hypothetical protein V6N13_016521 [Hibiscus sabdariffa]
MIVDVVDGADNWDWGKFQDVLPSNVLLRIVAKKDPMVEAGYDVVGWNGRVDLRFSIKSAYTSCARGLFVGLTYARDMGLNQVTVESDSMEAFRLVQQRGSNHGWMLIFAHIEELLS